MRPLRPPRPLPRPPQHRLPPLTRLPVALIAPLSHLSAPKGTPLLQDEGGGGLAGRVPRDGSLSPFEGRPGPLLAAPHRRLKGSGCQTTSSPAPPLLLLRFPEQPQWEQVEGIPPAQALPSPQIQTQAQSQAQALAQLEALRQLAQLTAQLSVARTIMFPPLSFEP